MTSTDDSPGPGADPTNPPPPSRADERWLSLEEIAALHGIRRDSAIRLVRRKGWARREGNRAGEITVAVPLPLIEALEERRQARSAELEPSAGLDGEVLEDIASKLGSLDRLEAACALSWTASTSARTGPKRRCARPKAGSTG